MQKEALTGTKDVVMFIVCEPMVTANVPCNSYISPTQYSPSLLMHSQSFHELQRNIIISQERY